MKQSDLRRELDKIWKVINRIEDFLTSKKKENNSNPLLVKVKNSQIESITEIPQEINKQSVAPKGLPRTKEKVVTTESGEGKSPVDIKVDIDYPKSITKIEK